MLALTVLAFLAMAANAADLKFRSAPGPEPVVGRYLVTLDSSVTTDLAGASAEALARAYAGQLEPYASSDIRQFAIAMLPPRARALSADSRVREVVEIAHPDDALAPPPSPPSATAGLARQHLVPITQDSSSSGTYLYDGSGNIRSIGTDSSFVYDSLGRLKVATVLGNQQTFTYDPFGNRIATETASGAVPCVGGCDVANTSVTAQNNNHLSAAAYDDAGNVTSAYNAAYTDDGTGMVRRATVGSDIRDFVYTADDERIAVRRGVSWTWSVRDQGGKVLREFTSLETSSSPLTLTTHYWSKDYVWRNGLLLASVFPTTPGTTSPTTTYHYHLDHLGTPRLVTKELGVLVGKHTYYPFGAEMNLTPKETAIELMKFTGHERDIVAADNATVDYMHARYYNGNLGRFLSVDPSFDEDSPHLPQKWNRYSYVTNNPLRYTDPNGQNRWDIVNGYFNSLLSDFGLTGRIEQNNTDYKIGQRGGDQAGVAVGFVIATGSGTGGVVTSPSGVGAIAGGVGVVYGLAVMGNSAIHLAQDSSPRSGGGGDQMKTIVEESAAAKKADGFTGKMKQGYEQIKDLLASGQPGKNQHALTGDLKGWWAADLPGSGGGRGATRVIYKIEDNQVTIKDIVNYHQ